MDIKPTGVEKIGSFLQQISPLLLIVGIIGAFYIEFAKRPASVCRASSALLRSPFISSAATSQRFPESNVVGRFHSRAGVAVPGTADLSGTLALGITGAVLMVISLVMALVDTYPGMPTLPTLPQLQVPLQRSASPQSVQPSRSWRSRASSRTLVFRRLVSTTAEPAKFQPLPPKPCAVRVLARLGLRFHNFVPAAKLNLAMILLM